MNYIGTNKIGRLGKEEKDRNLEAADKNSENQRRSVRSVKPLDMKLKYERNAPR